MDANRQSRSGHIAGCTTQYHFTKGAFDRTLFVDPLVVSEAFLTAEHLLVAVAMMAGLEGRPPQPLAY